MACFLYDTEDAYSTTASSCSRKTSLPCLLHCLIRCQLTGDSGSSGSREQQVVPDPCYAPLDSVSRSLSLLLLCTVTQTGDLNPPQGSSVTGLVGKVTIHGQVYLFNFLTPPAPCLKKICIIHNLLPKNIKSLTYQQLSPHCHYLVNSNFRLWVTFGMSSDGWLLAGRQRIVGWCSRCGNCSKNWQVE